MNQPLPDSPQSTFPEVSPPGPVAQGVSPGAARTRPRAWYRDWLLLGVLALTLAVDQASKELVRRWMEVGDAIPREGPVRLQYVVNTGSAFGLFQGQTLFLIGASLLGVVFLVMFYRSHARLSLGLRLGVGLMLGGALGNLADRFLLGGVTDFIAVGWWPNFNLADSSIVVGMTLVGVTLLRTRAAPAPRVEAPVDGPIAEEQAPGGAPTLSCAEEPPDSSVDGRVAEEQVPDALGGAPTLSRTDEPPDSLPR